MGKVGVRGKMMGEAQGASECVYRCLDDEWTDHLSNGAVRAPAPDEQKLPEGIHQAVEAIRQRGLLGRCLIEPHPPRAVVMADLHQQAGEGMQRRQLDQVEPRHVQDPTAGFGLHRVQVQRSTT